MLPIADVAPHVTYVWDMYHERPVTSEAELARRELTTYRLWFPDGRGACEAALRSAYGEGGPEGEKRRYGPFYVDTRAGEAFTLEWYAAVPDWAKPPADPVARRAAIAALASRTEPTVLAFEPPMPALECARELGTPDAIGRSVDVHMSHWVLAGPGGEPLHLGPWRVEATLGGWASGPEVPGVAIPAAAVRHLGPADVVHSLRISGAVP